MLVARDWIFIMGGFSMADDEKKEEDAKDNKDEKDEQEGKAAKEPMSTKKLIIIISASFAGIFIITIALLVFFLTGDPEPAPPLEQAEASSEEPSQEDAAAKAEMDKEEQEKIDSANAAKSNGAMKGKAIFYTIRPVFVVNFQDSRRVKFLQVNVDVMARDDSVIDDVMDNLPIIKNDLVQLFSSQSYDDLKTSEGKEHLRQEAIATVQSILRKETGRPGIEEILFTSFVMQ